MMVAIPNVTRTIENSRRDTFADVAQSYINSVRNSVLANELKCGSGSTITDVAATPNGTYVSGDLREELAGGSLQGEPLTSKATY